MPPRRKSEPLGRPKPPPAKTVEGRNEQLIAAAFDLVEQRIYDGTASAQETVHFLKMGSVRDRLEQDKLRREALVLESRVEEMKARTSGEEMYTRALQAFRGYAGVDPIDLEDKNEDFY